MLEYKVVDIANVQSINKVMANVGGDDKAMVNVDDVNKLDHDSKASHDVNKLPEQLSSLKYPSSYAR